MQAKMRADERAVEDEWCDNRRPSNPHNGDTNVAVLSGRGVLGAAGVGATTSRKCCQL
jgi:hypothetical protein